MLKDLNKDPSPKYIFENNEVQPTTAMRINAAIDEIDKQP